jgi:uncharacterized protein YqfB (UPF0267 family)
MDKSESHPAAVERFQAAREERNRRAEQYNAARDSPRELAAFTELHARDVAMVWTVREDRAVSVRFYTDQADALEAVGLRE